MRKIYLHILLIASVIITSTISCITPQRVNYLQDMTHGTQIELEDRFEAKISPYDELTIYISSHDQELSKPFNISNVYAGDYNSSYGSQRGYLVDIYGNIELPVLGKIKVSGLTRLELQEMIKNKLTEGKYLDDPFVLIRFNNFKIFFLGADGGKVITINNERCTFLEALALSGDLNIYTRRDKIAVMREIDGQMVTRFLDPRSSDVFQDPFFMLQQNDFIITQSMNAGSKRSEISYWLTWVSIISSLSSLATTLVLSKIVK